MARKVDKYADVKKNKHYGIVTAGLKLRGGDKEIPLILPKTFDSFKDQDASRLLCLGGKLKICFRFHSIFMQTKPCSIDTMRNVSLAQPYLSMP